MRHIKYTVALEDSGKTIKDILRQNLSFSASVITQLKKTPDGILCNGKRVFAVHKVSLGDEIEINLADKASENIEPSCIPIDIIYESEDILVINKPRSMPTHPSHNHHRDSLANAVMGYYLDSPITFRVITRLDKDTSGIVIIAKNKISASILTKQMVNKEIEKEYVALCHGIPSSSQGVIDAPIARKEGSAILRETNSLGKQAITHYEVIEQKDDKFLVRLFPKTGRTHQLRVHMAHIGTPILGDGLYGLADGYNTTKLHCRRIKLHDPLTNKIMEFTAPTPEDMMNI